MLNLLFVPRMFNIKDKCEISVIADFMIQYLQRPATSEFALNNIYTTGFRPIEGMNLKHKMMN